MTRFAKAVGCVVAAAALGLALTPAEAQRHGRHHHGHRHGHGHGHGGVFFGGLGVGIGLGAGSLYGSPYGWPYGAGYGWPYSAGPAYVVVPEPAVIQQSVRPLAPLEPVVEPRRGQSAEQTEADRRDCNRWATTQPAALADAGEFHRASTVCLEGRGYAVR